MVMEEIFFTAYRMLFMMFLFPLCFSKKILWSIQFITFIISFIFYDFFPFQDLLLNIEAEDLP